MQNEHLYFSYKRGCVSKMVYKLVAAHHHPPMPCIGTNESLLKAHSWVKKPSIHNFRILILFPKKLQNKKNPPNPRYHHLVPSFGFQRKDPRQQNIRKFFHSVKNSTFKSNIKNETKIKHFWTAIRLRSRDFLGQWSRRSPLIALLPEAKRSLTE